MNEPIVETLCRELLLEFQRDPRGRGAASMLQRYAERARDWRAYVLFDEDRYTRNLLHRCGSYELLLLCWGEGQESPIHNHDGQGCWMAVLDGEVEEVHFRQEAGKGQLIEGTTRRLSQGSVGFIEDEIALHLIRPTAGRSGISLHLYASAIDQCRVYDRETGQASLVPLGYHSVLGEPCDKGADAVRAEWSGQGR